MWTVPLVSFEFSLAVGQVAHVSALTVRLIVCCLLFCLRFSVVCFFVCCIIRRLWSVSPCRQHFFLVLLLFISSQWSWAIQLYKQAWSDGAALSDSADAKSFWLLVLRPSWRRLVFFAMLRRCKWVPSEKPAPGASQSRGQRRRVMMARQTTRHKPRAPQVPLPSRKSGKQSCCSCTTKHSPNLYRLAKHLWAWRCRSRPGPMESTTTPFWTRCLARFPCSSILGSTTASLTTRRFVESSGRFPFTHSCRTRRSSTKRCVGGCVPVHRTELGGMQRTHSQSIALPKQALFFVFARVRRGRAAAVCTPSAVCHRNVLIAQAANECVRALSHKHTHTHFHTHARTHARARTHFAM